MKETTIKGIYKEKKRLFTKNLYDENLRSWNPYHSKLAAAILNGFEFKIKPEYHILYLGAATGTTVSYISDITKNGTIYAVENSPIALKKLLDVCKKRKNVIPIFEDANHPDRYSLIVPKIDLLYQDISQRNQAQIFIENVNKYLKKNGTGVLMVKARSIDVSLKPSQAYDLVCTEIDNSGLKIKHKINLSPYEKDHMAIVISA